MYLARATGASFTLHAPRSAFPACVSRFEPHCASARRDTLNCLFFLKASLIDTQGINPKESSLSMGSKVAESILKVLPNQESIPVEDDMTLSSSVTPPIGEGIVTRLLDECDVDQGAC